MLLITPISPYLLKSLVRDCSSCSLVILPPFTHMRFPLMMACRVYSYNLISRSCLWCMPETPALKSKAELCHVLRPCLTNNKKQKLKHSRVSEARCRHFTFFCVNLGEMTLRSTSTCIKKDKQGFISPRPYPLQWPSSLLSPQVDGDFLVCLYPELWWRCPDTPGDLSEVEGIWDFYPSI